MTLAHQVPLVRPDDVLSGLARADAGVRSGRDPGSDPAHPGPAGPRNGRHRGALRTWRVDTRVTCGILKAVRIPIWSGPRSGGRISPPRRAGCSSVTTASFDRGSVDSIASVHELPQPGRAPERETSTARVSAIEESGCSITSPTTTPKNHPSSQSLRSSAAGGQPADRPVRRRPPPMRRRSSTACPSMSRRRSRRPSRLRARAGHRGSGRADTAGEEDRQEGRSEAPGEEGGRREDSRVGRRRRSQPPRKRAAKKVAPAAEEPADEVLSDVAVALEALTETVAEHSEPARAGGARRSGASEPELPELELPEAEVCREAEAESNCRG